MTGAMDNTRNVGSGKPGNTGIHPKVFMMMIAMVSMTMLFVALTSALLVKKADTLQWVKFTLPPIFLYSTLVIIVSSVFLHLSYNMYKKGNQTYKVLMGAALFTSLIFCYMQYTGWQDLVKIGMRLDGNVSGSFVYMVTGFHLAHLIGGILALLITFLKHVWKVKDPLEELKRIADINRRINFNVLLIFWHFLGGLWVYLFVFLFSVYKIS
jgi:cytochrome c oxidase subunit 3